MSLPGAVAPRILIAVGVAVAVAATIETPIVAMLPLVAPLCALALLIMTARTRRSGVGPAAEGKESVRLRRRARGA